jgi:hypothetical protein
MAWAIALIVVMTKPLWMNLWWMPRCDAIGILTAARHPAPGHLA